MFWETEKGLFKKKDLQYRDKRHDNVTRSRDRLTGIRYTIVARSEQGHQSSYGRCWCFMIAFATSKRERGYVHVNAPFNLVRGRHIGVSNLVPCKLACTISSDKTV